MKVGDYVRTNGGRIGKVTNLETYCNLVIDTDKGELDIQRIIKSSPKIIDLIEVGDYVNGRHVDKYQGKLGIFCELPNGRWTFIEIANEHYLISSIVTKEQFESMEYKLGE